jgi:hypothetical protein
VKKEMEMENLPETVPEIVPENKTTIAQRGEIPQSSALAEASPFSLSELFSRDPEELGQQDIAALVQALREQRERWLATGGATKVKPPGKASGKAAGKVLLALPAGGKPATLEDMDL